MKIDTIKFKNGDIALGAKIFLPDVLSETKGFIIFTHGLGYCAKLYQLDTTYFADNGYIFCMYNMRGHVGSTGEFVTEKAVNDISFIIDKLLDRYKIENKEMIATMAHSTGALISMLASINDQRIKCASIVSIVTSMADSFRHWFDSGYIEMVRNSYRHDGKIAPGIERFLSKKEALEDFRKGVPSEKELSFKEKYGLLRLPSVYNFFYQIAHSPDIFNYISSIKIPLIFFKGEKDEVIPVKKTYDLWALLNSNNKLVETKATNHFFNNYWRQVQEKTMEFFEECRTKIK